MEDLERMNTPSTNEIIQDNSNNESNIIVIDEQKEEGKLDNNVVKKDSFEYLEEFVNKINNGEKLQIEDFNLYHKIKKCNEISPLMIFILEKSIDKYNGKLSNNEIKDTEIENNKIEDTGFGYFPGITREEIDNNGVYFNSPNSLVFYSTFSEDFISTFWHDHQLLSDLLGINPNKEVLTANLNLAKTFSDTRTSKSNEIKKEKKNNKNTNIDNNQNTIAENNKKNKNKENNNNNKSNNSNNNSDNGHIIINDSSESLNEEEKKRIESNNKEFYKFSLGASFEYNALHFLLYGISEFINLPRIVFYPLFDFKDYEEIDSVFLIKKMRTDIDNYYYNFKSFDLEKGNYGKRKDFKLQKNDLIFVETTFDFDKKNKILSFMYKILKFINLYMDKELIESLNNYTIKPLVLYNNNYNISNKNLRDIKDAIKTFKITVSKFNNVKFKEIYDNLQIIYCWPTIPIVNNYLSVSDLNKKINEIKIENEKKINEIKIENEKKIHEIKIENEKNINELKVENNELQKKINNLEKVIYNSGIRFNIENNNNRFRNKYYNKNKYNNNNCKYYYKYNNDNYKYYYKYNNNNNYKYGYYNKSYFKRFNDE